MNLSVEERAVVIASIKVRCDDERKREAELKSKPRGGGRRGRKR